MNSISDLEMITETMAKEMAIGNIVAEIYPQILGLNPSYQEYYMPKIILNKEESFFNYRLLEENAVQIISGTDLPLFITNLPESIVRACFSWFSTGRKTWQKENRLSLLELLKSYTRNGFIANRISGYGELRADNSAIFAIFNQDLLKVKTQ